MPSLRDALFCFLRQARATLRFPTALLLSSFHPFVWMVLFGSLFQSVATIRGFQSDSYLEFLAPGVAIMSALFGSTYSGLGILGDIQSGLLDKFLATPVSRAAIIVGPLLNTTMQTVFQAAIILATAFGLGARPQGGVAGVLVVFVAVAIVGSTFAAVSHSLALLTRTQRTLISVVNFISLPLAFLSSMMMSRELMPAWIRVVALLNPVDWAVTVSRAAFNGSLGAEAMRPFAMLAAVGAVAWLFALRCVVRYQREG